MKRGIATFALDYGRCPPWLFARMVKLSRELVRAIVAEYGPEEFVRRVSDPVWFQSLGTVLAFDWNSSGLTTILTAALKEAIRGEEQDLGLFICGGKGKTSRKTPEEILNWGERLTLPAAHTQNLVYNSRMSAKVDSALIQDGFQIYHHSFFFTLRRGYPRPELGSKAGQAQVGAWTVVQQGMNTVNQTARRYHWFSERVSDLVCEPHTGIQSEVKLPRVLNLTAEASGQTRQISRELISQSFTALLKDLRLLDKYATPYSKVMRLAAGQRQLTLLQLAKVEFGHHPVETERFSESPYLQKILQKLCFEQPRSYERLLATAGVGPKTIRALALVAEVLYGAKPSYRDPARYSFAHGGKDATPYPVDRPTYDQTIQSLRELARRIPKAWS